jgi:hypothetical protein
MTKPSKQATLFASAIAAIALSFATFPVSAAGIPPHDVHEFSPSPEDERAAIDAGDDEPRKHDAAGGARGPSRAEGEGSTGAACQIPSGSAAGKACQPPPSEPVGAARSPYFGPGFRHSTGPKAYLLPLDDAEPAGN